MIHTFNLHVPAHPGSLISRTIAKGSAIVSNSDMPHQNGLRGFLIYYEGNIYGAANMTRFVERALSAAGRMRERYPTAAMMRAAAADLKQIGTFHYPSSTLSICDGEAFRQWAGEEPPTD